MVFDQLQIIEGNKKAELRRSSAFQNK